MSFAISQTSLTARSSSAFTSSVRVNKTRTTSSSSRHSSSSSSSIVTKCEGPSAKNLEIMRKFSEQYARSSGTKFCMDKSVTAVVIQGTFNHTTIATFSSFLSAARCIFLLAWGHYSTTITTTRENNSFVFSDGDACSQSNEVNIRVHDVYLCMCCMVRSIFASNWFPFLFFLYDHFKNRFSRAQRYSRLASLSVPSLRR